MVLNEEIMNLMEAAGGCQDFCFGAFQIQFYKINRFRQKIIQRKAIDLYDWQIRSEWHIQPSCITRMRKKLSSAMLTGQGAVFKDKR